MQNTNGENSQNETEPKGRSLLDELRDLKADADKGREPRFVPGRMGTRMISMAALLERIIAQFIDEHSGDSSALREATTEAKRLGLILATADYILAVESVEISPDEKAELLRSAYAELFTYGPLDPLFADPRVTTILLEGADKVSVRYGHGELTPLRPIFEDESHMRKLIKRLLLDAGAELTPEQPIIEAGLNVLGRPVAVNLVGPPVSLHITADIRLHPSVPVSLADMMAQGMISKTGGDLLAALARSDYGILVVGETESGKTALLSALVNLCGQFEQTMAVERAGEMHLPRAVERLRIQWPMGERPGITFGEQIIAALERSPRCIVLDEIRADEPHSIRPLLAGDTPPRQLWAFRGPADSARLVAALGMLARRSDPSQSEAMVLSLYRRLPFVVMVRRTRSGALQLRGIAEWQFREGSEYPDFVELMAHGWEGLELTGKRPSHSLDLDENFWTYG